MVDDLQAPAVTTCRLCPAQVRWVKTYGKRIPLEAEPDAQGPLVLSEDLDMGLVAVGYVAALHGDRPRYRSHLDTCRPPSRRPALKPDPTWRSPEGAAVGKATAPVQRRPMSPLERARAHALMFLRLGSDSATNRFAAAMTLAAAQTAPVITERQAAALERLCWTFREDLEARGDGKLVPAGKPRSDNGGGQWLRAREESLQRRSRGLDPVSPRWHQPSRPGPC